MLHSLIGDCDQHLRKQTKVSVFLVITVSDMAKENQAMPHRVSECSDFDNATLRLLGSNYRIRNSDLFIVDQNSGCLSL